MLPVLLIAGLHFFIAYRARMILPTLVREMSDGNYTMTVKKLRFNYVNPSITLTGISFRPVTDSLDQTYMVNADSLVLKIEKILPILFNRQVNVEDILIVSPDVEIRRNRGSQKILEKDDLNGQIRELQANAMDFLNELKVKSCSIKNASFRYFPFPGSIKKYNIRHINLSIADFNLPKPGTDTNDISIQGRVRLNIQNPQIEIPDSFKKVQLDYFEWSNIEHDINAGKFIISQRSLPPRADSFLIQLDTIAIRKIDWKVWLDSGIIKLDTILAKNGNMYFESSGRGKRKKNKDSVDFRKLKVWDAIGDLELDYFSAQYINVGIVNRNPGQERNNSLMGDSLSIHGLSIRPEKENPINVRNLALSVRSFLDRGVNNAFESSFSRLSLRGDTMLLNNYVLQSTRNSKFGVGNTLSIPALSIKGISLQDLMDKKANVREIRMDNPELNISSNIKKPDGKLEINANTFKEIRPYVDVDRVILNNAKVTVRSKRDKDNIAGTERFSAIILSKSALVARDAEGIMSSFTKVNMGHLFFITPGIRLEMFGGKIDYAAKALHFNTVVGSLNNNNIQAQLNDVSIKGASDLRPLKKDEVWHLAGVKVGSGTMDITIDGNQSVQQNEGEKLLASIDSMDLRNISMKFRKGKLEGSAMLKSFDAQGQLSYTSHYRWDTFTGLLEKVILKNEKFALQSDEADISSAGNSTFRNARLSVDAGNVKFTTTAPEIEVNSTFHSLEPGNISIDFLNLKKPVIKIDIRGDSAVDVQEEKNSRDFYLKNFAMQDPELSIDIRKGSENILVTSYGRMINGGGMSVSMKSGKRNIELENLNSSLKNVMVRSDSSDIFSADSVKFGVTSAKRTGSDPVSLNMENFHVGAVTLNRYIRGDSIELRTGGITLGVIPNFVLQKDSLLNTAFKIPPAQILPSSFFYRTAEKNIGIHKFSVDTREGYLTWDSLEVTNRLSRDSFFSRQPFEKDYITFSTGRLRADDLRPVIFGKDTTVYMRKLTLDPLYLKVERDKRMPDDTVTYRPLLVQTLKKIIPFPLKIDSINLLHSEVRHNVLKEKTGNEGSIYFTDIHGYIFNLRTFDYKEKDSIRIALESNFMGKGEMAFAFRQDYTDTLQGFLMGGRIGSLDMKEMNRLITPLFNVKINKGTLDSLQLRVKGNDRLAYGSMDMYYDDLKLSVLDDENRKKKMSSFLVNLLVRTKNSKTGIVYTERLREKSVFNYWARISLDGLLTSLGVRKNGAQERKFYRSLKKHQLPENIF